MRHPKNTSTHWIALCACAAFTVLFSGCSDSLPSVPSHAPDDTAVSGTVHTTAEPRHVIDKAIQSAPLATYSRSAKPQFERLNPEKLGIDMVHPLEVSHPLKRLYDSGYAAGGVAMGDIDGDGRLDMFFANGPRKNRLYRQVTTGNDTLRFEDISSNAGIGGGDAWGAGAVMVDIDGDSDLDIYVCNYDAPNHLFINDGKGRFTEQADTAGLAIEDACLFPAFADYDNDGDLDCYLLTTRLYRDGGLPEAFPGRVTGDKVELLPGFERYYRLTKSPTSKQRIKIYGRPDYLLRNEGNGRFTDVTPDAGISGDGMGLSATWCDFNRDGWIDMYVANDGSGPDRLYANNADGTFRDVAPFALPRTTWFSMGSEAGDLNNDGQFDLLVLDMSSTTHYKQKTTMGAMSASRLREVSGPPQQLMRNALFLNSGTGRFREAAYLAGLADSDWAWAPKLADFDCDGRLDVYISNGVARNFTDSDLAVPLGDSKGKAYWDHFESTAPRPEQNLAFRNRGDLAFDDVSASWGLDHTGMSYATATGDLDNDGDLDLVVVNLDVPVSVYRNHVATGHRVAIQLKGRGANTQGLGALVAIQAGSGWQIRQLSPMTGFLSSNEPRVHFGLGADTTIERLVVQWPGGTVQTFDDLPADQLYTITQSAQNSDPGNNPPSEPPFGWPTKPIYGQSDATAGVAHRENEFDDFARQPLLPNKLSQLGPAMAIGDVDGDGREDLFMGGAADTPGQLFFNRNGKFIAADNTPFEADRTAEDMGAVLLDADSDGDLDLYVASGGYEFEADAAPLLDRLYLNDGAGQFQRSPATALPSNHDSGSCAVACDFDRDGDLDLFVGGRCIPGRYPLSPNSRLLRNDSTSETIRFTDVTDALAPGLRQSGLVTSALWSDANGDGWLDLLIAHEWGPIKLFRNKEGHLKDRTAETGTDDLLGWWNGITGRDIDGDGDIDYVVSNFGLNTKYHASQQKPASLYYGDFDGHGKWRLIEAEHEGDKVFPVRGKSCSTHAMPHLAGRFSTYHTFALAELADIYTPRCLDDAYRYKATTLASGVFLNDGNGRFRFLALPQIAQISPAFGVTLTEINGDGHPDLYMVQNFSSPQAETGRMNGGLSQALLGRGDGHFVPVAPNQSGLLVLGDARAVAVTDLNNDRWPDFIVSVNDDKAQTFLHQGSSQNDIMQVRLQGAKGNATAVGAKVTLLLKNGHSQTAEVYAGDGYLTQSSPLLSFGIPANQTIARIDVRWPDGSSSKHKLDSDRNVIVIRKGG
jgi:hypothetical protein